MLFLTCAMLCFYAVKTLVTNAALESKSLPILGLWQACQTQFEVGARFKPSDLKRAECVK